MTSKEKIIKLNTKVIFYQSKGVPKGQALFNAIYDTDRDIAEYISNTPTDPAIHEDAYDKAYKFVTDLWKNND